MNNSFVLFLLFWLLVSCNETGQPDNSQAFKDSIASINYLRWRDSIEKNEGLEKQVLSSQEVGPLFKLFRDIESVRNKLSNVGIGELHPWRSDEAGGYVSISDYFLFGAGDLQNSFSFYLLSKSPDYIESMEFVMNINNNVKAESLKEFSSMIQKIYSKLGIPENKAIIKAAGKGREISTDNPNYVESIELEQSRIESWKFVLKTK